MGRGNWGVVIRSGPSRMPRSGLPASGWYSVPVPVPSPSVPAALSACTDSAGPIQIGSARWSRRGVSVRVEQNAQPAMIEHQPRHQFGEHLSGKGHLVHRLIVGADLHVVPSAKRHRKALADPARRNCSASPRVAAGMADSLRSRHRSGRRLRLTRLASMMFQAGDHLHRRRVITGPALSRSGATGAGETLLTLRLMFSRPISVPRPFARPARGAPTGVGTRMSAYLAPTVRVSRTAGNRFGRRQLADRRDLAGHLDQLAKVAEQGGAIEMARCSGRVSRPPRSRSSMLLLEAPRS